MKASLGQIVLLKLSEGMVDAINRRRTTSTSIAERIANRVWPLGAQAHIGNTVKTGEVYPMVVSRLWDDSMINGQVLLDGNDTYWATSVHLGENDGDYQFRETDSNRY